MARRVTGKWDWAGRILVPIILFSAVVSLVVLLVVNPLVLALAQFLIAVGGEPFAGNFDLLPFLTTLPGVLTGVLLAGAVIFLWAVRMGGLMLIAWSGRQAQTPRLGATSLALAQRLPQLLLLSIFGFLIGAAAIAPVLAAALFAKWFWLSGGDIYFYVTTRPPEFYRAAGLVGIVALICMTLGIASAMRWIMALAFCVIGGASAREALRLSTERTAGRRIGLLWRLALAAGVVAVLSLAATAAMTFAFDALFWPGQSLRSTSRTLLVFAAVATFLVALINAVGHALNAMVLTEEYARLGGGGAPVASRSERAGWPIWVACAVLPFLAAGQSAWTLEKFDLDEPVRVTAHRAGGRAAPENTLAALERAIEAKADYAEIDVQETRDGEIIVIHDTDLRRVAGVARPVWELDLAEIQALDAGAWFSAAFAGERIPTLREFAERSRGRIGLNVELKDNRHGRELARKTLAILKEEGVLDRAVITSLSLPLLADTRRLDPDVPIGYIASTGLGDMLALDVDFYSLAARIATPAFIARARAAERDTHVWGVDAQPAFVQAILDGAANLITDDPILARTTIAEMEDLSPPELTLLNLRRRLELRGFLRR